MIRSLQVENFQSLQKATVDLGQLTVLVGASNSGKSALLRAFKLLLRNSHSASFVTHGRKAAVVKVVTGRGTAAIERGPGKSEYTVAALNGREERYTKCGTTAPSHVGAIIAVPLVADSEVAIAGQFDKPFLLDEPATKVAKVLGDLTNVNVIFAAVREANRRRLACSGELKTRKLDLEAARQEMLEFADLPTKVKVLEEVQSLVGQVEKEAADLAELEKLISDVELLNAHLAQLRAAHVEPAAVDLERPLQLASEAAELKKLLEEIESLTRTKAEKCRQLAEAKELVDELAALYNTTLRDAGRCPVCGSDIGELK